MKIITQLSRVLVGALFIFSGLIKLNDPMGFAFKLHDYFAPGVLNMPFLDPYTLELSLFIVVLEVLLGVALLLGLFRNLTSWLLLLMIVFFTFLTFYSAYFNKVTDCGCFGDAIPLTPWESFGKDVILTVLILIIFLNRNYIQPLFKPLVNWAVLALSFAFCVLLGNYVLNHLPVMDFRPYAEGMSIVEGMKSAEELGLEPTQYATVYVLKNANTGEEMEVGSDAYVSEEWWKKKEWEIQADQTKSVMVKEGYEPPVHDFIITLDGIEITDSILQAPAVFLVTAYRIDESEPEAYTRINPFARQAQAAGLPFIGLSASLPNLVDKARAEHNINFPIAVMDETALKTMIRSNPGIFLLSNGKVVKKWHHNDLPPFEQVQADYL